MQHFETARGERPSSLRRSDKGMSLIEILVVITVMAMALLAAAGTTLGTEMLRRTTGEKQVALDALRNEVDRLQGLGVQGVLDEFNGLGTNVRDFSVRGLDRSGALAGRVEIITDETLTEQEVGAPIGMPRDLDGDGLADNPDTSTSAVMLPVIVRLTWRGTTGTRSVRTVVVLHRPRGA